MQMRFSVKGGAAFKNNNNDGEKKGCQRILTEMGAEIAGVCLFIHSLGHK